MAIIEEIHKSSSLINKTIFDWIILAKIAVNIAIIWVAVLHFEINNVLKFFPDTDEASLIPEIANSRHKIIADGIIAYIDTILNPTINKIAIETTI